MTFESYLPVVDFRVWIEDILFCMLKVIPTNDFSKQTNPSAITAVYTQSVVYLGFFQSQRGN